MGLLIAGLAVLVLDSSDSGAWGVMLAMGIVVLSIFFLLVPVTPKRIWKRTSRQFEVRTLQLSEEGIYRHTALNDTMMRWPMFSEARQRGDLYLLIVGKGPGCFIIPERAFDPGADEMAFRELLQGAIRTHLTAISS
jgi:hypothetical protein